MKQVVIKKGEAIIEDVSSPVIGSNDVLVKNFYSVISTGTEVSSLDFSRQPMISKLLHYPEKVAKGLKMVKERGFVDTYRIAKGILEFGQPSGYSSSGEVVSVGENVSEFKAGDLVACAGAGYANHAEMVAVPKNLVVHVPVGLSLKEAASATIGSIALQGVRQADLKLGEWAVVSGLGLLGQLTVQMLKANGIKVIGLDLDQNRLKLARSFGVDYVFTPDENAKKDILRLTGGYGVDGVIITAATTSNEPLNFAMEVTRKKGVVVVVGAVGLNLKRSPWYQKEIDLKISCSYGPGRYDESYEENGIDYPYAYVRWTENRNMSAYLELLNDKKISFEKIISKTFKLEDAGDAYNYLLSEEKPLVAALDYGSSEGGDAEKPKKVFNIISLKPKTGSLNLGLIGVGSFATAVHLPNLLKLKDKYNFIGVATRNGVKAKQYSLQYGFQYSTTAYHELLNDKNIDAVLISTRHDSHAKLVLDALKSGKHVFVEKPLALNSEEIKEIEDFIHSDVYKSDPKIFMVGFNRRYSPLTQKVKDLITNRKTPLVMTFRVNDGYLPKTHWVHTEEGGGRILGNACHMIDLFGYLVGSKVKNISVNSVHDKQDYYLSTDNFVATFIYEDGSVANLVYSSMGDGSLPKEHLEVFSDGRVYVINDFRSLDVFGGSGSIKLLQQDKGHFGEIKSFVESIQSGQWPIPMDELLETAKVIIETDRLARK